MSDNVRVNLYLPTESERTARELARATRTSRNDVFRRGLALLHAYTAATESGLRGEDRDRAVVERVFMAPV